MAIVALLFTNCFLAETATSSDWMRRGFELSNEDNLDGATDAFRRAAEEDMLSGIAWQNLGVALLRKGTKELASSPLMQSAQALHKATALGANTNENLVALKNNIELIFPGACFNQRRKLFEVCLSIDRDISLSSRKDEKTCTSNEDRNRRLADLECKSRIEFKVTASERERGFLSSSSIEKLAQAFGDCGVLVIKGGYDRELIENVNSAQHNHFQQWFRNSSEVNNTSSDIKRSEGRYEIKLPMRPPFTNEALLRAPLVYPLLQNLLGHMIEIDTFGLLTLFPHTPKMHWHRDTAILFSYDQQPDQPSHGIVVFIPMVDISTDMGPTEFILKTQIPCAQSQLQEYLFEDVFLKLCPWFGSTWKAIAGMGDAILLDTRILHRGTENRSDKRRPMLKISYVKDFWYDSVNYKNPHTQSFETLSPQLRKLLTRVDTRGYFRHLEALLKENELELGNSKLHYRTYDYKVLDRESSGY